MPAIARNRSRPAPPAIAILALLCAIGPIVRAGPKAPPDPDLAGRRVLCFPPGLTTRKVSTYRAGDVVLWTDSKDVGGGLLPKIVTARRYLESLLPARTPASAPASAPADQPVSLAIYATEEDYQALWKRVGQLYGGWFGEITTDGYSYRRFCATYYGSQAGFAERRAVLCHEFAHVWLYQNRALANDGNWLTEGLATAAQLRLFPEAAYRLSYARWMETGRMLPLKRLMDQSRLATKDYWQAATLMETIIAHHPGKLPAVVTARNEGRSAYYIVSRVLKTDFPTLSKRWAAHVRSAGKDAPGESPTTAPFPTAGRS